MLERVHGARMFDEGERIATRRQMASEGPAEVTARAGDEYEW